MTIKFTPDGKVDRAATVVAYRKHSNAFNAACAALDACVTALRGYIDDSRMADGDLGYRARVALRKIGAEP